MIYIASLVCLLSMYQGLLQGLILLLRRKTTKKNARQTPEMKQWICVLMNRLRPLVQGAILLKGPPPEGAPQNPWIAFAASSGI